MSIHNSTARRKWGEGRGVSATTAMSIRNRGFEMRGGAGRGEDDRTKCYKGESSSHEDLSLINNFINRGLLIPRASDNIFVIHRDVTAKHRWGFFGLGSKHINKNVKYWKRNPRILRGRTGGLGAKRSVINSVDQTGPREEKQSWRSLSGRARCPPRDTSPHESTGSCTRDIRCQISQWCEHLCRGSEALFQTYSLDS